MVSLSNHSSKWENIRTDIGFLVFSSYKHPEICVMVINLGFKNLTILHVRLQ